MTPETMILPDGSEITVVHLLVVPRFGRSYIACMPGLVDFSQSREVGRPVMRTDECRSVTCPLCKGTEKHKQALEAVPR